METTLNLQDLSHLGFEPVSITFATGYVVSKQGHVKQKPCSDIFSQIFLNVSSLSPDQTLRCFLSARVPAPDDIIPLPKNITLVKHGKYTHIHMSLDPSKLSDAYVENAIKHELSKVVRVIFALAEDKTEEVSA